MEKEYRRIGILGGGQLAKMSAYYAFRLGFDISILEKNLNSPAGMMTKNDFEGWVNDDKIMGEFASSCDIITLESEFIDSNRLLFLENLGKVVLPSSKTIALIQDKFIQKSILKAANLPLPEFVEVNSIAEFSMTAEKLGLPFVLKSKKLGYDGYGNAVIYNENDFIESYDKLIKRHNSLYAEKFVNFTKELAVLVVKNSYQTITYPIVETIQENNICKKVIAPAAIDEKIIDEANKIAIKSINAVNGHGIFAVEMFLTTDNKILINELAPRPHNSGHYTMDACVTSQFENHVRAVLDLPLGDTSLIKPYAVMINLLGKKNGKGNLENYSDVLKEPDLHLHIYAKEDSRMGRKMGHITITGNNLDDILNRAEKIEKIAMI
ncbi:MAG: 5-(carboxyamino)imidazole ribonucleotide synthase [bacterium]